MGCDAAAQLLACKRVSSHLPLHMGCFLTPALQLDNVLQLPNGCISTLTIPVLPACMLISVRMDTAGWRAEQVHVVCVERGEAKRAGLLIYRLSYTPALQEGGGRVAH
jgi:hypothetical protein